LEGPVIHTPEKVAFLASDIDVHSAVLTALDRAVGWVMRKRGLCEEDAAIVASLAGNVRICQLVNGNATVSFELPGEVLPW
jgi:acetamidase/formamidase